MLTKKKLIIILLLLMVGVAIFDLYQEYVDSYNLCIGANYSQHVNCSSYITFKQYKQEYSFLRYIKQDQDIIFTLLFSKTELLLTLILAFVIAYDFDKKNQNDTENNQTKKIESPTNNYENRQKNNESNLRKNNNAYFLLVIGLIPFILLIFHVIKSYTEGFGFLFSTYQGLEAMIGTFIIDLVVFWPIGIIGLALIINSLNKISKNRKNKDLKKVD